MDFRMHGATIRILLIVFDTGNNTYFDCNCFDDITVSYYVTIVL
jgi:hypothetical protein